MFKATKLNWSGRREITLLLFGCMQKVSRWELGWWWDENTFLIPNPNKYIPRGTFSKQMFCLFRVHILQIEFHLKSIQFLQLFGQQRSQSTARIPRWHPHIGTVTLLALDPQMLKPLWPAQWRTPPYLTVGGLLVENPRAVRSQRYRQHAGTVIDFNFVAVFDGGCGVFE